MACHRYFCDKIDAAMCELSAEESHHAASVIRAREGDTVEVFDGRGTVADATVSEVTRQSVHVVVARRWPQAPEPHPSLSLQVAVPKGSRPRVLVEKCTELGVNVIQPIVTGRSAVRPRASVVSRWRRYAIEAAKQSRQAWLPRIQPPLAFDQSIETGRIGLDEETLNLIASPGANARPLAAVLRDAAAAGGLMHVAIWIGPEGGFTPDEMTGAMATGLQPVSLGTAVLRIETAAIAAVAAMRLGQLTIRD